MSPWTAALLSAVSCLGLAACADDDAQPEPSPSVNGDAGDSGACALGPDCARIEAGPVKLEPCCSAAIRCGYQLVEPAELRDTFFAQLAMVEGTDRDHAALEAALPPEP